MSGHDTSPNDLLVLSLRDAIGPGWLIVHALTDNGRDAADVLVARAENALPYPPVWLDEQRVGTRGGVVFHQDDWQEMFRLYAELGVKVSIFTEKRGKKVAA